MKTLKTPNHEPIRIGEIGNYYGGLSLKREDGKDLWSIENWDGEDWQDCPAAVADALRQEFAQEFAPATQVYNETAEADRPLEPSQTEGTHIHAALLAQDDPYLYWFEGCEVEVIPGKRKPMDSAGDLLSHYPDLATDLARDDKFTAAFLKEVKKRGIQHFDPANPSIVIRTANDYRTVARELVGHDEFVAEFLNALAQQIKDREVLS